MATEDKNKKKSIDDMLQNAAIEKFGLKPVMDKIEKVMPLLEQVAAGSEVLKGQDGKSPELGVDYLTPEQQQAALEMVRPKKGVDYQDGNPGADGYTPIKGLDYFTDDEVADVTRNATPVKGRDYYTAEEAADFKKQVTPIKGVDYKDGENPTPAQFIEVVKALKGKDAAAFSQVVGSKIDISHVRNAGTFIFNGKKYDTSELMHGGGSGGGTSIELQTDGVDNGSQTLLNLVAGTNITLTNVGGAVTIDATGGGGTVDSVVGTANRISVDSTDPANPVVDIAATYVGQTSITTLGTISTGTWAGTTVAVAHGGTGLTTLAAKSIWVANSLDTITSVTPGAGQSIRINAGNTAWEAYTPAAGTVTSVSGTTNRISSTGGATPVIDIDAAYVGQTSITTLGTIATGTWAGTAVAVVHGGTGGTSASITLFNNITGYTASGATGTTSTNLVFSTSPTLSNPVVGTQASSDNSTLAASTAFVTNAIATAVTGLLNYRGSYDASTNLFPATGGSGVAGAILKGDFWICSVGGTLGGVAVTPGDLIIALIDTPGQTAANWDLIAHDLGSYVTSITGTANQVIASSSTGAVTLSLPQSIATTSNPQFATIELGAATDTTISRSSAGVIAVEGVIIPSISSTNTLTNKRITPRVLSAAAYTTDTGTSINGDTQDMFIVTAQTGALKFNNPSGTPTDGQKFIISVASSTTSARALTWDTAYGSTTVTLPTTTAATTATLTIGFIWSASKSLWQCVAVA